MTFEEFTQLVNRHDLTYMYSDDNRVWKKGKEEREVIEKEAKNFPIEDVKRVWIEAADRKVSEPHNKNFYWGA